MVQHVMVTSGCLLMTIVGQVPLHTLLGQTSAPAIPTGGVEELAWRLFSSLGSLGILAYYFYQTQTKTLPDKDKQIADERAASDAKVKAACDAAAAEAKSEREAHKETVDQLVKELQAEREARMAIIRQCDGPTGRRGLAGPA